MQKNTEKLVYAKDKKCCKCGKPAVCFWPMMDPDIPHYPYCRKCVEEAKIRVLVKLFPDGNFDKLGDYFIKRNSKKDAKRKMP